MARVKIAGTSGASENTIVFSSAGGHSHNGQNSSLIDSTAYSMYDFSPTFVGTEVNPDRAVRQENNRIAFEDVIKRVVNNSVLAPAGIRLEPGSLNGSLIIANTITANQLAANTITAAEISAGTITANELSSNIVLINNRIVSQNWNGTIQANGTIFSNGIGSAGWAITNTHAVFDSTLIRGSIAANSLLTPNLIISNTGAITSTSFNVTAGGNVTATNANITGTITSGSGAIGGWTIDTARIYGGSTYLYSNGSITIGATTIAANGQITNGGYTLSNTGVLTATGANINGIITSTSGTIGGWTINPSSISAGSTALYSNGFISASTGSFTGVITTTSGTIGGWTINGSGLQKTVSGSSSNIYPGQIVLGILTDESSGDTVLSAARMTLSDENYIARNKTSGYEIIALQSPYTTSYFKHFGAQLYGTMTLYGGNLTATNSGGFGGTLSAVNCNVTNVNATTVAASGDISGANYTGTTATFTAGGNQNVELKKNYLLGGNFIRFFNSTSSAAIGAIEFASTTTVAYKTSSDKRLKENVTAITGAFDLIKKISPVEYNFISEDPLDRVHGFLAQDLYEQYPYPVCVGSDDLKENPWGIDYSKMTPLLTAALKEAIAKIEELESRLQALEAV